MPLARCPRCEEMFQKEKDKVVCEKCIDAEEADQDKISQYVSAHPDCAPTEVANVTGVNINVVKRMVELGRIAQVTEEIKQRQVRCGRCGAPAISFSKKLCEACLADLNNELARVKSSVKLPPKKWSSIDPNRRTVREELDEKRG